MAKSIMQSAPSFGMRIRAWWRGLGNHPDSVAELKRARLGMVQRGEYVPLGTILMIKVEDIGPNKVIRWIQFPTGNGPALGRFADGSVDLLDAWEWNGLPPRYEGTNEMCPDCAKAPCVECFPAGVFPGSKLLEPVAHLIFEPGERLCTYGNQVECCGGTGKIASQDNKECPSCEGTGKVKCRKCRGTAEVSTGYVDWDNDLKRSPSGKICESCGGSGRVRKVIEQDGITNYYRCLLGPIHALMLMTPDKHTQPWKGDPDNDGVYPHIISDFTPGARAVIVGGVLRPDHTNSGRRRSQ